MWNVIIRVHVTQRVPMLCWFRSSPTRPQHNPKTTKLSHSIKSDDGDRADNLLAKDI